MEVIHVKRVVRVWEDDHSHPRETTRKAKRYDGISQSVVQANAKWAGRGDGANAERRRNFSGGGSGTGTVTAQGRVLSSARETTCSVDKRRRNEMVV